MSGLWQSPYVLEQKQPPREATGMDSGPSLRARASSADRNFSVRCQLPCSISVLEAEVALLHAVLAGDLLALFDEEDI